MSLISSSSAAKVTLSNPFEIEGDWEFSWFDSAHQHFLLLNDSYLYILAFDEHVPSPRLFAHIRDLPSKLLCGKVSLDRKLVAIQATLTTVIVVDIPSKKKWLIDIRYPHDNAILAQGIIWSDHGGNSEDLVIVTTKGLELYKVSQVRAQCKLSRVVSQTTSAFWYNPEHRFLLLAAFSQARSAYGRSAAVSQTVFFNADERPKEMLQLDGFYLNSERPSIPMMELPPPEKVPRLEVGPGVALNDVSLVSLYGRVLCLVRYVEHGTDFITVYHMTKARAERTHCLSLNCLTHGLMFSVYDNLLICHCIGERVSLVFDILSTTARAKLSGSAAEKTQALGQASAMHFVHRHHNSGAVVSNSSRTASTDTTKFNYPAGTGTVTPQKVKPVSAGAAAYEQHPLRETDISVFESLTFVGELSPGAYSGSNLNNAGNTPAAGERYQLGSPGNMTPTTEMPQYIPLAEPMLASEVYSTYAYEYLPANRLFDAHRRVIWDVKCSFTGIVEELTSVSGDPREIPMFLARRGQRHIRLRQAAQGSLDYSYISMEGRWAKQLCMRKLFQLLLQEQDLVTLKTFFKSLMRPYSNEFRRLVLVLYDQSRAADSAASQMATAMTATHLFATAGARKKGVAETLFRTSKRISTTYGSTMGVYLGNATAALGGASGSSNGGGGGGSSSNNSGSSNGGGNTVGGAGGSGEDANGNSSAMHMEQGALELLGTLQFLMPDISMVAVRARKTHILKQQFLKQQQYQQQYQQQFQGHGGGGSSSDSPLMMLQSGPGFSRSHSPSVSAGVTTTATAATGACLSPNSSKIKPTCQAIPLSTRRDAVGNILCTQAELLSHVWLPLLLSSETDFNYLAWALLVFIAHLRESNLPVAPACAALLLNVLFHSRRHVEVGRALHQRALPDSIELALYSLEFCDMLQDHIHNNLKMLTRPSPTGGPSAGPSPAKVEDKGESGKGRDGGADADGREGRGGREGGGGARSPSPPPPPATGPPLERTLSAVSTATITATPARVLATGSANSSAVYGCTPHDQHQRDECSLQQLRQGGLDVLWRLDERVIAVKWHLSHGNILEAMGICKKRAGKWQPPLVPGSISAVEFFTSAVSYVSTMQKLALVEEEQLLAKCKEIDAEIVSLRNLTNSMLGNLAQAAPLLVKETRRVKDISEVNRGKAVNIFYSLYLFIKEWDPSMLVQSTVKTVYNYVLGIVCICISDCYLRTIRC
jgi:hypothetical protein